VRILELRIDLLIGVIRGSVRKVISGMIIDDMARAADRNEGAPAHLHFLANEEKASLDVALRELREYRIQRPLDGIGTVVDRKRPRRRWRMRSVS
jgi:hypothetical protein